MKERVKSLFQGKRKFLTIPALPVLALLAWPFVIPGLLGLFVHTKVNASQWKYGLLAVLALVGLGSAPSYYANFTHSTIAQPQTVETRTLNAEVKAALAPTETPTPTPTHGQDLIYARGELGRLT